MSGAIAPFAQVQLEKNLLQPKGSTRFGVILQGSVGFAHCQNGKIYGEKGSLAYAIAGIAHPTFSQRSRII
jgi:hypothetical protein